MLAAKFHFKLLKSHSYAQFLHNIAKMAKERPEKTEKKERKEKKEKRSETDGVKKSKSKKEKKGITQCRPPLLLAKMLTLSCGHRRGERQFARCCARRQSRVKGCRHGG